MRMSIKNLLCYTENGVTSQTQSFGKGRKASLFILSKSICIGNTDAGIDPGFVDIESTAVFTKDFKHRVPPTKIFAGLAGTGHPAKSSQLRKR